MPARRVNPYRIKLHRSYSVQELAACCAVHKNTVRNWQQTGLEPIDKARPVLFHGESIRTFLMKRSDDRKSKCAPGQMYCLRCRVAREPALGMVDYIAFTATSGNLRAICGTCDAVMHRRARQDDLARVMPGIAVQFVEGPPRLSGRGSPSLNCDFDKRGVK